MDVNDLDYEEAAKRESKEETGLELDDFQYVTSSKIDDWRYRSEEGKIFTTVFSARYIFGRPEPNDDVSELRWFHFDKIDIENDVVEEHQGILKLAFLKVFNYDKQKDPTC